MKEHKENTIDKLRHLLADNVDSDDIKLIKILFDDYADYYNQHKTHDIIEGIQERIELNERLIETHEYTNNELLLIISEGVHLDSLINKLNETI